MNADRFPGVLAARRDGRVLADNGGGAQVPRDALDAVAVHLERDNAQKGGGFARKKRTAAIVGAARAGFAELVGVAPETIAFGLNATTIAYALARTIAHTIRPGDRIVVTDADHYANIAPWEWLRRFGAQIETIPLDAHGELDEDAYERALAREPVVVALPWASNATGNVFDLARFAAAAKDAGALVLADGVQAAPHLRVTIPDGVDAVTFSGYKIFAPHFGACYAHPEFARRFFTLEDPAVPGTPFSWTMETGTQNYEGLAGWLGTLTYLRELGAGDPRAAMDRIAVYERELTRYTLARFAERADALTLYGRPPAADRLPLFAFNVRGEDPAELARRLDAAGIEAAVGDFHASRTMAALAPETGGNAVRLSFAHYSDTADVDRCFAAIDAALTVNR